MNIETLIVGEIDKLQQTAALLMAGFARTAPAYVPNQEIALQELEDLLARGFHLRVAMAANGRIVGLIGGKSAYDGNVWELHPLVVHRPHAGGGSGSDRART
jgi:aminoglycoside 6'-N-acetyltransferase I